MNPSSHPLKQRGPPTDQREQTPTADHPHTAVELTLDGVTLAGDLTLPSGASGIVLFAHGSGSSRHSPRNQFVARAIQAQGCGTLLFDLLTRKEEIEDTHDGHYRLDISLLARRLAAATTWVNRFAPTAHLGVGYFGASTGGAAALVAAAQSGARIDAVISRGGRPNLAGAALARVKAPTLLIVGEWDELVRELNEEAFNDLKCVKRLAVILRATHLFEEPGALAEVASLAANWFRQHLRTR